jgi:quinol monooxygenase YgiN
MSPIRVTGRLRLATGKMSAMLTFVDEMKTVIVDRKETGTLVYDFYQSDDDPQLFIIHEGYADENSFNIHMNNIVEVAGRYPNLFAVESVQVCGDISKQRRTEVISHFGDVFKFFTKQL